MAQDHYLESLRDKLTAALEAADLAGEMIVACHLQAALDALDSQMMADRELSRLAWEKLGQQG